MKTAIRLKNELQGGFLYLASLALVRDAMFSACDDYAAQTTTKRVKLDLPLGISTCHIGFGPRPVKAFLSWFSASFRANTSHSTTHVSGSTCIVTVMTVMTVTKC